MLKKFCMSESVFYSVRWKILLGFNCRNRLLLTGTPIQNSMAEVCDILKECSPN